MWPWNRPKACEECEKLRREFKELTLTVESALDKVYHWMKRHSSRAARGDQAPGEGEERTPEAVSGLPPGAANGVSRAERIARLNKKMGLS